MSNASRDGNRVPTLLGVSTVDGTTPVPAKVDPANGQLQVAGGGGGTQYTDGGATVTHPVGTMPVFDNGGTISKVGTSAGLPVQGTVTANIGTSGSLALDATLTGGTQQTKITDGTNVANTLKSDGTAAGQNSILTATAHLPVSFTTTSVQAVGSTDVSNYRWFSVQITSQGTSSTVTFQGSNDNSNWISVAAESVVSSVGAITTSTTSTGIFQGPLNFRYFRLNVTGISAGTTAGTIEFFTAPGSLVSIGATVAQSGTWTVQPGNTANTTSWNMNLAPSSTGGWSPYFANAVTSTATVSAAAGKFGGYMLINLNSAPAYLQVFDTTGAVTLGTTTPTFVIPIPANSTAANGVAANLELANGVNIANGIKIAATTTATGSTTVSTGLSGSIWYK